MKKFAKIMALALVVVMAIAVLVACGYSDDPQKAKEQLENKGFTVSLYEIEEEFRGDDGLVAELTASKKDGDKVTVVSIAFYETAADAKADYEEAKAAFDSMKSLYEAMGIKVSLKLSGKKIVSEMSGTSALLGGLAG